MNFGNSCLFTRTLCVHGGSRSIAKYQVCEINLMIVKKKKEVSE